MPKEDLVNHVLRGSICKATTTKPTKLRLGRGNTRWSVIRGKPKLDVPCVSLKNTKRRLFSLDWLREAHQEIIYTAKFIQQTSKYILGLHHGNEKSVVIVTWGTFLEWFSLFYITILEVMFELIYSSPLRFRTRFPTHNISTQHCHQKRDSFLNNPPQVDEAQSLSCNTEKQVVDKSFVKVTATWSLAEIKLNVQLVCKTLMNV